MRKICSHYPFIDLFGELKGATSSSSISNTYIKKNFLFGGAVYYLFCKENKREKECGKEWEKVWKSTKTRENIPTRGGRGGLL